MGWFKDYFYNTKEMTEKDYKQAEVGFIVDNAMSIGAYSLMGGSYFAALLAFVGASEALSNFILSFALLGGFFQILVPAITKKMQFKKPFIMFCKFFDRMPMALMFFVPLFFGKGSLAVGAVSVLAMIGFTFTYFMSPVHTAWFMDCLDGRSGLGKFCGIRDAVMNACMIVTYFVAAKITGTFTGDKEIYSYIWLGGIAFVMWAVMMGFMVMVKEPYKPRNESKQPEQGGLIDGFKTIFTNKQIRPFLKYNIFYNLGLYLMSSLVSIMCVQRMNISLEILSYLTMGDYAVRTTLSPLFGKMADKVGARKCLACAIFLTAVAYGIHAFMTHDNAIVLKIISVAINSVAGAMLNTCVFMFKMQSVPEEKRGSCIACLDSFSMLLGTAASWITTWFISVANGFSVNAFRIEFSEMNLVFIIGSIILIISSIPVIMSKKQEK